MTALVYDGPERRNAPRTTLLLPEAPPFKQAAGRIRVHLQMIRRLIANQHVERETGSATLNGDRRDGVPSP